MKIGFIGAGKMAEAIIASLLASKKVEPHEVHASDLSEERRVALKHKYGINTYSKNLLVTDAADLLFLAVKPQQMQDVLTELAKVITPHHLVVSIAAGKKIASIQEFLPGARIVRVMPNVCCLVSEGMNVFCPGPGVTSDDRRIVADMLSCVGEALELPEDKFDVVTAVSGSGPAFFAYLMQKIAEAGERNGLDKTSATLLARQTMYGTAKLLLEKNLPPGELIDMVTSPNGTTWAGRQVLENSGVDRILDETITAAVNRSVELGR